MTEQRMTGNCPFCKTKQELTRIEGNKIQCLECRKVFQVKPSKNTGRKVVQGRGAVGGRPGTRRIRPAEPDPFAIPELGSGKGPKPILKTTPMKTGTLLFSVIGIGVAAVVGMLMFKLFSSDPPPPPNKDEVRAGTREVKEEDFMPKPTKKPPKTGEQTPPKEIDPTKPPPKETPVKPVTELPWPHGNVSRTDAVDKFRAGVVMVTTDRGTGSGWVLHPRGLVVTNHRVVDRAAFIKVGWVDGTERSAGIFALYPTENLAILELPMGTYEALPVAWSHTPNFTTQVLILGFSPSPDVGLREAMTVKLGTVNGISVVKGLGQVIMTPSAVPIGNNGAPLIDLHRGGVVGTVVARSTDPTVVEVIANAIPMWRFPTEHVPELRPDIEAIVGGPVEWYVSRPSMGGDVSEPAEANVAPISADEANTIYVEAKAKAEHFEARGEFAEAQRILNDFMLRGEASLRRKDPKIAEQVTGEVHAIKTRLHAASEARWKEYETQLQSGGGSIESILAVRDRIAGLVPAHQARAADAILTILDSQILTQLAKAKELLPNEAPRPDKITLTNGNSMEGRIVEETDDRVTMEFPRGGKMTFTRDQIASKERGNLDKIREGKERARDALQNALVLAYSDPVRAAVRARVEQYGGVDATEITLGEPCETCVGLGGVNCDMCETIGYIVTDCPTCAAKEKQTCMYCLDKRVVKHYGMGALSLQPKLSKGQECRNCGGDGIRFKQPCSICAGTGRVGQTGEAVVLDLGGCDEQGNALTSTGRRTPCKDLYPKLKKSFSSWEKSMSAEDKAQRMMVMGVGSAAEATEKVREIYLKIEEFAICDKGNVPCMQCRNTCPNCDGGKIKSECKTCSTTGSRPCLECGGVGTTLRLNSMLMRSAPEALDIHQKRLLPRLKD